MLRSSSIHQCIHLSMKWPNNVLTMRWLIAALLVVVSWESISGQGTSTDANGAEQPSLSMEQSLTTVVMIDQTTSYPPESLFAALYTVIAVICVFSLVIVTLSVTIVLLQHKRSRCGRADIKAADQKATNSYSGFSNLERERLDGTLTSNGETRPSSLTSSTHPLHLSTRSPAPLLTSSASPQDLYSQSHSSTNSHCNSISSGYSKLAVRDDDMPPACPPKNSSTYTPTSILVSGPFSNQQSQESRVSVNEPKDKDLEPQQVVPCTNIYNTLEGPGHQLSMSNMRASHPDYDPVSLQRDCVKSHCEKSTLFDDPDYVSVRTGIKVEIIDPRYTGDYERSPEYTCPTVKINASEIDPKYRGDYERDPTYIPKFPSNRASFSSIHKRVDKEPAFSGKSIQMDALSKYRGDYERSPTYIAPPLRDVEVDTSILDCKYSGNYERDPIYMANLMKRAHEEKACVTQQSCGTSYSLASATSITNSHSYVNVQQNSERLDQGDKEACNPCSDSVPKRSNTDVNGDQKLEEIGVKHAKVGHNHHSDSFLEQSSSASPHRYVNVDLEAVTTNSITLSAEELLDQGTFMDL